MINITGFRKRNARQNIILVACFLLMLSIVCVEGIYLSFAAFAWGGVHGFIISGMYLLWVALSIATSRYFAFPLGAMALSWLSLFWVAAWDWSYQRGNSELWRVYFYGYPIAYIVASHAGYLLALRKQSPKILADRSSV